MAHKDWLKASRRVFTKVEVTPYGEDYGTYFYAQLEYDVFQGTFIVQPTNGAPQSTTRYLQITGNKIDNDYPVDIEIKSRSTGDSFKIIGNSKLDCIIDFGEEIDITEGLEIKVTKFYKGKINKDAVTNISFKISYDVADLLKSYDIQNGTVYDGESEIGYGIKENNSTLNIIKDKKNKGICPTNFSVENVIAENGLSTLNVGQTEDNGVMIDGIKTYTTGTYAGSTIDGTYYNMCSLNPVMPMTNNKYWSDKNSYVILTAEVYNPTSEELDARMRLWFYGYDPNYNSDNRKIINGPIVKLQSMQWTKIAYLVPNNNIEYSVNINQSIHIAINKFVENVQIRNVGCSFISGNNISLLGIPTQTNIPDNIKIDGNKIVVYNSLKEYNLISRSELINRGTHIIIKVRTDGETVDEYDPTDTSIIIGKTRSWTTICNLWVKNIEYDENDLDVRLTLTDIFGLMSSIYEGTQLRQKEGDSYQLYTVQEYLYTIIKDFNDKILKQPTSIDFEGLKVDAFLPTLVDRRGETYFTIVDDASKASNTYISQDYSNNKATLRTNVYTGLISKYHITNDECYSITDKRRNQNNVSRVIVNSVDIESNSTQTSNILAISDSFTECTFKGYTDNEFNTIYDLILPTGKDGFKMAFNPFIVMDEIDVSGTITVPKSEYSKYQNVNIGLLCATAYRQTSENFGIGYTLTVDGEVNAPEHSTVGIISIGVDASPRQYAYLDSDNNEQHSTDISLVGDNSLTLLTPTRSTLKMTQEDENTVTFEYSIKYDPMLYTSSMFGEQFKSNNGTLESIFSWRFYQRYLGAYKVALFGKDISYTTTENEYGVQGGNQVTVPINLFIQQGATVYGDTTDIPVSAVIGENIYNEFKNGKKVAKIEYIGSPYLKLYDIITLENGIEYILMNIKTSSRGGFKQTLTLVEKGN